VKRVLFLSYYFPPIGGAGAQRPTALVRHLPRFGYEPVVVTGPGGARSWWTPRDEALFRAVSRNTEVVRVGGPEPEASSGWRSRAERILLLKTAWERWWVEGVDESAVADADLVYAWMSPFETAEAARRIAERLGVPWVADLGDPWALDEMIVYPSRLHRRAATGRMRRGLTSAAAVVMSTPEAVDRVVSAFPEFRAKHVVAVPNGFEAADFEGRAPARDDGIFRIVHTGYFHTELGLRHRQASRMRRALGGWAPGVDFLTRSHVHLLEAVDLLLAEDPGLSDRLEVHFAGVLAGVDRDLAERSPVARVHGYLAHDETLELLGRANLLFLPMHNLPRGTRAGIVPGKTYEYLGSGRPVLAAVPDGDARDILTEAGNAYVCRPDDTRAMADAIKAELARVRAGLAPASPRADVVARYEYGHLASELAATFDHVLGGGETRRAA
jgi:glycosyltransferase involved in cell wall biosynthesis